MANSSEEDLESHNWYRTGQNKDMDSQQIAREVEKTLLRYRTGMISLEQSRQELALLLVMLKAYENIALEDKLDRIQAVLEGRR